MLFQERERLACMYCDRLMRELGEAFKELSRSAGSPAEENSARMHLGNILTLLNLHKTEHAKELRPSPMTL
jgi:hypothetical protein